ncbi:MAG: hypothetical protein AAGG01_00155, partial [Planctomycetota bacterium]
MQELGNGNGNGIRRCQSWSHGDRRQVRGAALISSLIVAMTVALLGAWILQVQSTTANRQKLSMDTKAALYVAEAGLAEASFQVAQGKSGNIGSEARPASFEGGVYWVEAEELSSDELSLTSTARVGVGQFRVNLKIIPNRNVVSHLGVFGDEGVVLGDRVLIDGYDSALGVISEQWDGSLAIPTTTHGAVVGSNGDIEILDGTTTADTYADAFDATGILGLSSVSGTPADLGTLDDDLERRYQHSRDEDWVETTTVAGDVFQGPDSALLSNGTVRIRRVQARPSEVVLPDVLLPESASEVLADIHLAGTMMTLEDASYEVDTIRLGPSSHLVLKGPIILEVRRLELEPHAWLALRDRDGPITIYVTEELIVPTGSVVSSWYESEKRHGTSLLLPAPPAGDPDELVISSTGDIRGIIYAPGHRIVLEQSVRLYGSIIGKHVTIADGGWISIDRSLNSSGGSGFPTLSKRLQWSLIARSSSGLDPLGPTRAPPMGTT